MIPVRIWARLQLFDQFSAHFHMHDIIWWLILISRLELWLMTTRAWCFCFICGSCTASKLGKSFDFKWSIWTYFFQFFADYKLNYAFWIVQTETCHFAACIILIKLMHIYNLKIYLLILWNNCMWWKDFIGILNSASY